MDWINLKRKLKVVSNLFNHNYKNVVIEISTVDMVVMIIVINPLVMTHAHHMERYVLIYKLVISILKCHTIFCVACER